MSEDEIRSLRGPKMAMVFQDPLSPLRPFYKVGDQIIEAYREHHPQASKADARKLAIDMVHGDVSFSRRDEAMPGEPPTVPTSRCRTRQRSRNWP